MMQTRHDILVVLGVLVNGDHQVVTLDPSSQFAYKRVLMEWTKVRLVDGSWRNALLSTGGVSTPLLMYTVKLTL